MNQMLTTTSEQDFQDLIRVRFHDDPDWIQERRLLAAHGYFELDWPHLERTPLKKRRLEQISVLETIDAPPATSMPSIPGAYIQLVNNHVAAQSLPDDLSQQGIILLSMRDAVVQVPDMVKPYLGSIISDNHDKMNALNGALWQNGIFLHIPANLPETVHVTIQSFASSEISALMTRHLIVCEKGSHVIVTERLQSDPGLERMLVSQNTEIVVKEGAHVQYGAIQLCSSQVEGFIHRSARVAQDALLEWNIGEFGAGLLVSDHVSLLEEPGASTKSVTVFFGSEHQHQDYTAKSYHQAPHTTSDIVARGVMKGHARSIFTGLTQIEAGAKGSDGRQREQTLMLSDDARADAIPSLIIDERDVFAAHAASAGPIDKLALFYLTSRGLTPKEAERMIVHGFLAPVIDSIPLQGLRDEVWAAVEGKIRQ